MISTMICLEDCTLIYVITMRARRKKTVAGNIMLFNINILF